MITVIACSDRQSPGAPVWRIGPVPGTQAALEPKNGMAGTQ